MSGKTILTILCLILALCPGQAQPSWGLRQQRGLEPSATYMYAAKDSIQLYLDVYEPAVGSETTVNGKNKPTVLFMFGGGFKGGQRNGFGERAWFSMLTERGFRVVAIDYRLGLRDMKKINLKSIGLLDNAIDMAVRDLFSATRYIIDNPELGIDPDGIVLAGSSAGAISVLQAEWEVCNGMADILPDDFNYAGVMAFSGAIFSKQGKIRYRQKAPCPHLMLHGTADHIVLYKGVRFINLNFAGTSRITRTFKHKDYVYSTVRYEGNGHEIASSMIRNTDRCVDFMTVDVMQGTGRKSDTTITDPSIQPSDWGKGNFSKLY